MINRALQFQGDVAFIPVDSIPKNVKPRQLDGNRYIVTHSETGHHHVIDRPANRVEMFDDPSDSLVAYLNVIADDVHVEHLRSYDTHAPISLSPGSYKVSRQRQATPEGWQQVQD